MRTFLKCDLKFGVLTLTIYYAFCSSNIYESLESTKTGKFQCNISNVMVYIFNLLLLNELTDEI